MRNPLVDIDIEKIQSIYKEAVELINNNDPTSAVEILEKGAKDLENIKEASSECVGKTVSYAAS